MTIGFRGGAVFQLLIAVLVSVVAHTAAVSPVHMQSPEGLRMAQAHAARDTVPGLRREVEKVLRRLSQQVNPRP